MGCDITRTREIPWRPLDGIVSVEGWLTEHDVEHDVEHGQDARHGRDVAVALYVPEPSTDGVFGRVALHVELPASLAARLCEAIAAL